MKQNLITGLLTALKSGGTRLACGIAAALLLAAGYDQGFYDMKEAVKEYCDFLDKGGYFEYGK